MSTEPKVIEMLPATRQEGSAVAVTPADMIQFAMQAGNIELVEKAMALYERWEANQARKAFDEAVALAKVKIKPVGRNKTGHNSKKYADFAAIAREVDPVIGEYGLSYRFSTRQDERIHVTCKLSHKAGHCEETTLSGPADVTGNKNAIQAIGSTLTYLQRYSLMQALGLAAGEDDDGAATGPSGPISEKQKEELQTLIVRTNSNLEIFYKTFNVPTKKLEDMPASEFERAIGMLKTKLAKEAKK